MSAAEAVMADANRVATAATELIESFIEAPVKKSFTKNH
jgi:hypothetical protein